MENHEIGKKFKKKRGIKGKRRKKKKEGKNDKRRKKRKWGEKMIKEEKRERRRKDYNYRLWKNGTKKEN